MAALGRLWAIASMTLLEASRRKVFTILIIFTVALLSSVTFFPAVKMDARLRLMEAWSLRAATFFTAIVALFVSGFSFPGDFETRRIYLLVSKPVSKLTIFLGRLLGFAVLLAIFLGIMGTITIAFIRVVALLAGPAFPQLAAYPQLNADEFAHHRGMPVEGFDPPRTAADRASGAELIWRFRAPRRSAFPETVNGTVRLVLSSPTDSFRTSGTVAISVSVPGREPFKPPAIYLQTHEEGSFSFPASLIDAGGPLEIRISPGDADGRIYGWADSVTLNERAGSFELNFAKGLVLALIQSMLVLSVTLMASTFLSGPVSVMLGILFYIVGSIHGYALEGMRDIDRSLLEVRHRARPPHRHGPEEIPKPILRASSAISKVVLAAVPDFDRFDFSRWLLKDRAVSWGDLAKAAWPHATLQIAVLTVLGMLVMAFKDFSQ